MKIQYGPVMRVPDGGPGTPVEPAPSLAERILCDYAVLKNKDAVSFVLDLGLMAPVQEGSRLVFGEALPATGDMVAAACGNIQMLPLRGNVEIDAACFSDVMTRADLAKALYEKLHAGLPGLPTIRYQEPIRVQNGTETVEDTYLFFAGGNAVEYAGTSSFVLRNSTICGTTTRASMPLSGPPAGLTVGGSIRTTLALKQAQGYFINSRVISKDWAVFSTDGAEPVNADGEKELSLYIYGSEGVAENAGYGIYSDLFCNAYFYGTDLQAAELGAISGTYGALTFDTIAAGEKDPMLCEKLTETDRALQPEKDRGCHLTGGRNAFMIHCVSLPPYWERPGYSQKELPLHEALVTVRHSVLKTDLRMDRHIPYPEQVPQYLKHVAGSVILIKSCNARILLDDTTVLPDPQGTGAILHTAINSDLPFMVRVPDGITYPGIHVTIRNSDLSGRVLHEDYQRDLYLTLEHSALTGAVCTGTVENWNAFCKADRCENYIIDPHGYGTVHGTHLTLGAGSTWNVTGESNLQTLTLAEGAKLNCGSLIVDDASVPAAPGTYRGRIILKPI